MADVTSALRDGKTWLGLIVLALVLLVGIFVTGPFRLWSWLVAFKTWLLVLVVLELAMALATRSRDVKVYLGIGVSVFFIWLAFRKLDPAMMWDSIVSANPWLLGFVSAQVLFMLFVRGHRWALFLKPVKPGLSWIALGWSTCIGFAVNNVKPILDQPAPIFVTYDRVFDLIDATHGIRNNPDVAPVVNVASILQSKADLLDSRYREDANKLIKALAVLYLLGGEHKAGATSQELANTLFITPPGRLLSEPSMATGHTK